MHTAIPPREETGSQISARLLEVISPTDPEPPRRVAILIGESRDHAPRAY